MRITASKIGLLEYCGWWARDDAQQDPRRTSDAAERGTRFHAEIAHFVETGELRSVDDDIQAEMAAAVAWLSELGVGRDAMQAERAFGWDALSDTAELYDVTDRDYPDDGKLHGTADLLVWRSPGCLEIYDWKTGDGSGAGPQLRGLGLAAARVYGLERVTVAALEVTASGVREVCRETLDAFALAAIAGELSERIAAVPSAEPVPGSHCGELYCPARLSCPLGNSATAELVDVIPADALVRSKPFRLTDPIQTAEHAAWAIDVIRLVAAKLEAIKEDIKARVPADGWHLDDGRILRETRSTISYVDKDMAVALARRLGATDQDIESCMRSFDRSNGLRVSGGNTKPRARRTKSA